MTGTHMMIQRNFIGGVADVHGMSATSVLRGKAEMRSTFDTVGNSYRTTEVHPKQICGRQQLTGVISL